MSTLHPPQKPKARIETGRLPYFYGGTDAGPLSIKCLLKGVAHYRAGDNQRYVVDDSCYLILNQGQAYDILIDSPTPVQSFCIFFTREQAQSILYSLNTPTDQHLDTPVETPQTSMNFFEKTYAHDGIITPAIRHLAKQVLVEGFTIDEVQEDIWLLLERLLRVHHAVYQQMEAMPAVRFATREELYRRLHIARDYMHACLHEPLTLEMIAAVALLSPHYFLRMFKAVFRQTPHAYLTQKRLERARYLLGKTDTPVTEICFAVGFQSLGSFSSLFHRDTGMSPRSYRQFSRKVS